MGALSDWMTDVFGNKNPYEDKTMTRQTNGYTYMGRTEPGFDKLANQAAGRTAPYVDQTQSQAQWQSANQGGADQTQALGMLWDAANGKTPSVAQQQMQQGLAQSQAAQMSAAQSARGGAGAFAAAQRLAQNNMGAQQQNVVADSSMMRAQEMANARGQLFGALAQKRAQDLQAAGLSYDQAMQQAQLELANRGGNDASYLRLLGMGQAGNMANQQGQLAYNQLASGAASQNAAGAGQNSAATLAMLAALAGAASDERLKTSILDESEEAAPYVPRYKGSASATMLEHLTPISYEYKADPGKRRYGIVAQDLERSPMGASIVIDTPGGKVVDTRHAALVALGALADMHGRVKKLEGGDR